jgi:hypothetical protein
MALQTANSYLTDQMGLAAKISIGFSSLAIFNTVRQSHDRHEIRRQRKTRSGG